MSMSENIKYEEDGTYILSEELLKKIKTLRHVLNYFESDSKKIIDKMSINGNSVLDFEELLNRIILGIDINLNWLERQCKEDNPIMTPDLIAYIKKICADVKSFNPEKYNNISLWFFLEDEDVKNIERLLDYGVRVDKLATRVNILDSCQYIGEKYVEDMQYYYSESEINEFKKKYYKALREQDVELMKKLTEPIRKRNLEEWQKIADNIENMTDEDFCFVGVSTRETDFKGDFKASIISGSLFNQDVNDPYIQTGINVGFGFIVSPSEVIAADSKDLWILNDSNNTDNVSTWLEFPIIRHPKSILEECKRKKDDSLSRGDRYKVYSEVALGSFEPIGIFCFADGIHSYEYEKALKLQKSFPNLKIKCFDVFNIKRGIELEELKIKKIRYLLEKLDESYDSLRIIIMRDIKLHLPRFDYFFKELSKLRKRPDYTEEDEQKIFEYNIYLIYDSLPKKITIDELLAKKEDELIKYKLGKSLEYNIDELLKGNIMFDWIAFTSIKQLEKYIDILDFYYEGLGEFVDLLSNNSNKITNEMFRELEKEIPLTFPKMTSCLSRLLGYDENQEQEIGTTHI